MLIDAFESVINNWFRAIYSRHASILKRDKTSDFLKLNTLETNVLTSQKWLNSSSTLDPATTKSSESRGFELFFLF